MSQTLANAPHLRKSKRKWATNWEFFEKHSMP